MVPRRLRWALGFSAVMAASAAGLRAEGKPPADVLKDHGLKRVGSTYVLAEESAVQKKLSEARALSRQLSSALAQQEAFEQGAQGQKEMVQGLTEQRMLLSEQLNTVDQQMKAMGRPLPGSNPAVTFAYNQLVDDHNALSAAVNALTDRINLLGEQAADPRLKQEISAEVPRRREAYTQVVLDLRQLVEATTKAYAEVASSGEVKQALDDLGRTSKNQAKLGPSREFLLTVKLLERIEKSVISDSVELRRDNGVFWVDVMFNGKVTRPMVFDTGASLTLIPASLAAEIGLKPLPSDPVISCHIADGSVVEARKKTIPSMRVGRFTVNNVACAVMPAAKGNVDPLLGQSFFRYFECKFSAETGKLAMTKVETLEPQSRPARPSTKNAAKTKRGSRARASKAARTTNSGGDAESPF